MHLYLDHSQEIGHFEKPLVERVAQAGVEVTVGTSPAGSQYIAHEKGWTTADGDCGEGSTNFSQSAWLQANTMLQFISSPWRDLTIQAFNTAVEFAWTQEPKLQVMSKQPSPSVLASKP
jgi:hypothetical protein